MTVAREKIGNPFGCLGDAEMLSVTRALALFPGIALELFFCRADADEREGVSLCMRLPPLTERRNTKQRTCSAMVLLQTLLQEASMHRPRIEVI